MVIRRKINLRFFHYLRKYFTEELQTISLSFLITHLIQITFLQVTPNFSSKENRQFALLLIARGQTTVNFLTQKMGQYHQTVIISQDKVTIQTERVSVKPVIKEKNLSCTA